MHKFFQYLLFIFLIFSTFFALVVSIDPVDTVTNLLSLCSSLFNIWIVAITEKTLKLPVYVFWFFIILNGLFCFKTVILNHLPLYI
jgi:hypothetical protein